MKHSARLGLHHKKANLRYLLLWSSGTCANCKSLNPFLISYFARFRSVEKSAFIIFILRLVNAPNLTQPPFKHTEKIQQRYARGTDTIAHPSYHCCSTVHGLLPIISVYLRQKIFCPDCPLMEPRRKNPTGEECYLESIRTENE